MSVYGMLAIYIMPFALLTVIVVLDLNLVGLLYNSGGKIDKIEAYKHENKRLISSRKVK